MGQWKLIKKKFYVGSTATINAGVWTHATVDAAVKHAKELCEEMDETQYVVQVIRVIKKKSSPIVVEKV